MEAMGDISSPCLPPTSDPALYGTLEFSGQNFLVVPSSAFSDDLEALQLVHEEKVAENNKAGIVIQHRAWATGEAFRSDQDYSQDSPLKSRTLRTSNGILPSSPTTFKMPSLLSSPPSYPLSSSPPITKRPAPAMAEPPQRRKMIGGFINSDSEDDAFKIDEPAAKRRMLEKQPPNPATSFEAIKTSSAINKLSHPTRPKTVGGFLLDDDGDEEVVGAQKIQTAPPVITRRASSPEFPNEAPSTVPLRKQIKTCSGNLVNIWPRRKAVVQTFEEIIAARSTTKVGRAKKAYYGIDINQLIDDAKKANKEDEVRKSALSELALPSIEYPLPTKSRKTLMWTEKYRAKKFFDLVGDDRTHREVLRWLKGWDPIVFPRAGKAKPAVSKKPLKEGELPEKQHRKILLLTGPPGLGKTTLAHVCAGQAGYEIMEINASDERSSNVVKGRIRTTVGTESVKTVSGGSKKDGHARKSARPVCVVVDEVDGVVSGAGGSGEGGFIKALIDLIQLDAKNSSSADTSDAGHKNKKKGDNFRLLRPLILICNDVYHPSLRPLRQSSFAEVIHMRKPPLEAIVNRMKVVFEKEGISCDTDGIRKLCEATWGISSGPEARFESSGTAEGDIRSVLVVGEWAAGKLKTDNKTKPRLTKKWVEQNMLSNLGHGGDGTRGVGRGGVKEIVSRVFITGAGFPKPAAMPFQPLASKSSHPTDLDMPQTQFHAAELVKKVGMDRLREMVDTSGDIDRIVTDIFSVYPSQPFHDDSLLSKPDVAYEWLHFHDACSTKVYSEQSWELMAYMSQPVLACHHLFASASRHYHTNAEQKKSADDPDGDEEKEIPFTGPRADYEAKEAEKSHRATILELQGNLNATLLRSFRSPEDIATDLLPYLVRMLTPEVNPIIVGGSGDQRGTASVRKEGERDMVKRAVEVMNAVGVIYERGKLEGDFGSRGTQWVYRMEPPLDTLVDFATGGTATNFGAAPVRYGVRQVLDQEFQKNIIVRENAARQRRFKAGNIGDEDYDLSANKENSISIDLDENPRAIVKKDFFGRVVRDLPMQPLGESDGNAVRKSKVVAKDDNKVWVTFHEGFSNAVRKPVTLDELMRGL